MKRKIVRIDEEKCNGCGDCVPSCAEGAIQIIDGKAKLVSDVYCDGLGACLGTCPMDAITIEEREADAFDGEKAMAHVAETRQPVAETRPQPAACPSGGCPGSMARKLAPKTAARTDDGTERPSQLMNWPVQLTLVSPAAPYLQGAEVLLAADCAPFAYADFHKRFMTDKPVIIACPKLDDAQAHAEKLAQVLQQAKPAGLTIIRMEVPCCGGLTRIAETARQRANTDTPLHEVTIGIDGTLKGERKL